MQGNDFLPDEQPSSFLLRGRSAAKARFGGARSRRSCHSASARAFAVSVSDRYGDKSGQPSPCPGAAMTLAISGRCSCEVRRGFPGRAMGRVGYLGGTRDAAWALASASLPGVLLLLVCFLFIVLGCLQNARHAVVWKGQDHVAHFWCVCRAHSSVRQMG